jgi:hypothetical protein
MNGCSYGGAVEALKAAPRTSFLDSVKMAEEPDVELIKAATSVSVPKARWDEFTNALGAVAEKLGLKHIEPVRQIQLGEQK